MKKHFLNPISHLSLVIFLSSAILGQLFISCQNNPSSPSLYDPNYTGGPTPTLATITPQSSALAGVTKMTITGTNFSTAPGENYVFFDAVTATVTQATATQLNFIPPNLVKDSIKVKVAVLRAPEFSNTILYKLDAAVAEFGNLAAIEEPYGIACDSSGNLYVSMTSNSAGIGIKKYTPAGVRSDYAPASGVTLWSSLKVGSGGLLYAARTQRALFTIAQNSASVLWVQIAGSSLYDFDFDKQGNIWAVGNNSFVYRVAADKTVKTFPFVANLRSVRVYNDYLYVGGKVDSTEGVWRFPINSTGDLGTVAKYFDLSALPGYGYNGPGVYPITFNKDGDMYLGSDGNDGILLVHPNGSAEPFYPGLFKPQTLFFAWGTGSTLYATRSGTVASHTILKINTQKSSAPYYGRGDK